MSTVDIFKSIIVDDDPLSGATLQSMIERCKTLEFQRYFANPYEGLTYIQNTSLHVLFLDVEMPDINGIEFIKLLDVPPPIILISMQPQYAVSGFDLRVLDFLIKPISYTRFLQAVNRLREYYKEINNRKSPSKAEHLFIKDSRNQQWIRLELSEIIWIEAKGDYATIHTLDKRYTIYTTMKKLLKRLPKDYFLRVHRSYIIQLKYINAIEGNTLCLNNKLIPLGGVYAEGLLGRLNMV